MHASTACLLSVVVHYEDYLCRSGYHLECDELESKAKYREKHELELEDGCATYVSCDKVLRPSGMVPFTRLFPTFKFLQGLGAYSHARATSGHLEHMLIV